MPELIDAFEAAGKIKDGAIVMIGGFLAVGTPETLVDSLVKRGVRSLTVIANDTAFKGVGIGKLIVNHQIANLIVSHIGTNPETGRQLNANEINAALLPQGTLAERIRAGGAGLGGILTPTGVGTVVAENKTIVKVNDKDYLLELPIRADFALINAQRADRAGNLVYHGSACNFNPIMALAADIVIAEIEEYSEDEFIDPDQVVTPGILVDYLVKKVK